MNVKQVLLNLITLIQVFHSQALMSLIVASVGPALLVVRKAP